MRKLWVKAWTTLDGVFDADTMDYWWQNTNSPERMRYITEEYSNGDAYLLGRVTYEMLWPGWSKQTTGDGPGPILNRMHKYVVSTTLSTAPSGKLGDSGGCSCRLFLRACLTIHSSRSDLIVIIFS